MVPLLTLLLRFSIIIQLSSAASLFDFQVNDIAGKPVDLKKFKGKTLLIVNTASRCGFTDSHLKDLTRLRTILHEEGNLFEVLAFPCNDFGGQDPGSPEQIEQFMRNNYQSQFPIFEKVAIAGETPHPLWKHIIHTSSLAPQWNFYKYLFNAQGKFVAAWDPQTRVPSIFDKIKAVVDSENRSGKKTEL